MESRSETLRATDVVNKGQGDGFAVRADNPQIWLCDRIYFDCRATDGTTPASRFFRRSFPDLFESVLSHIEELPMLRQRRQALAASH
jgi:hypothetical protein